MSVDVHALAGPYALDALADDERRAFEEHLAACVDCRAEVAGYQAVAGRLGVSVAETPPARLKDEVFAAIRNTRQLPPNTADHDPAGDHADVAGDGADTATVRALRRWRRGTFLAVAAAVLAVVAGTTVTVIEQQRAQRAEQQTTAMTEVFTAPDARLNRGEVAGGGSAAVTWSAARDRAIVVLDDLPPNAKQRTYQLWLMRPDGTPRPSRTVHVPEPGRRTVQLDGGLTGTTAIAMTVEPAGGSPAPTSDPILELSLD